MLTKRQQQVLKAVVASGGLMKTSRGLWFGTEVTMYTVPFGCNATILASASTVYALAHQGLVDFVGAATVAPTPKGEALATLLNETTMVTRRGSGVVIS